MTKLTKPQIAQTLATVKAHHPSFHAWMEERRAEAVEFLTKNSDPITLYRSQGQVSLLDEMLDYANNPTKYMPHK